MTSSDKTPKKIIEDAIEILTPDGAWTRGNYRKTQPDGSRSYCAVGALREAAGINSGNWDRNWDGYITCFHLVQSLIGKANPMFATIEAFNDYPDTTKEDVLLLLRKAVAELDD